MWNYKNWISVLAVGAVVATGCSNDDDGRLPGSNQISPEVKAAFAERYPNARGVEWEVRGGYAVADFSYEPTAGGQWVSSSAWFDQTNGTWLMSEDDLPYSRLPQAVTDAFKASEYASWQVDDVDVIRRQGVTLLYVIEVESGRQEMSLYFTEDGTLVKALTDGGQGNDYTGLIPSSPAASVTDYIQAHYPDARIVEIDSDNGLTEVELVDAGRVVREIVFDRQGAWLYTQTSLRRSDLPAVVMAAWSSSEYAEENGYRLDDADYFETADGEAYYRLELDSRYGDVKLRITPEGQLSDYTPEGGFAVLNGEIEAAVQRLYPGATIMEKDYEHGYLEVDIRHDGREKEVLFDGQNNWVLTRWDVSYRNLPEAVVQAFRQSDYANGEVDDIYYAETNTGAWYVFEVEDRRTDRDYIVRITPQGEVVNS